MNTTIEKSPRTSLSFRLVSAGLAFVLWGGWAYYVGTQSNAPGGASATTSGLAQGTGSFIITLLMVRSVSWLHQKIRRGPLAIVLPAVITVFVTGSCLAFVHSIVGTTNIARTIGPALTIAFLFNVYTTYKLSPARQLKSERAVL